MAFSLMGAILLVSGCLAHRCISPTALGNMGHNINSEANDYAPVLRDTATLIFTSNRAEADRTGLHEAHREDRPAQFYMTMRLGLEWDKADLYDLLFVNESEREAATLTFAPTPNVLNAIAYLASHNGGGEAGDYDIFMVPNGGGNLVSPGPKLNSPGWDGHPFITADGSRLYFASERSGGYGGTDIWYVEQEKNGLWGAPRNAGSEINTSGDELSPFVESTTGDLYFAASTQRDSLDLFVLPAGSKRRESLPPPYNSAAGEITPFIKNGKLYLASNRDGGCGGYDLYMFPLR
ncbi:MAG: PD40 domain-containing protein [Chlorobi bacterium]|nr:PD40 domain-containing protein [Chlorobiota bacterium]